MILYDPHWLWVPVKTARRKTGYLLKKKGKNISCNTVLIAYNKTMQTSCKLLNLDKIVKTEIVEYGNCYYAFLTLCGANSTILDSCMKLSVQV